MAKKMRSISTYHTADYTIPENPDREYLFITFVEGEGELFFNGGDGGVPLKTDGFFRTVPVEVGSVEVKITSATGAFVVHVG